MAKFRFASSDETYNIVRMENPPPDALEKAGKLIEENMADNYCTWPDDAWYDVVADDGSVWDLNLFMFGDEHLASIYPTKVVNGYRVTETRQFVEIKWEAE